MNIAIITTDEPFYLPNFFKYLLENLPIHYQKRVIITPPTYKGFSKASLVLRYINTFGVFGATILAKDIIYFKLMDLVPYSITKSFYSISSLLRSYDLNFDYESDVNSHNNLERLKKWNTDLVISISCPQIFKKDLIGIAKLGCLNLHGSLLPKYRGVMPSFWMLANNEKIAGITLFFVNEKIDAGDILIQRQFRIRPDDSLDSFIRRSKIIGAEMVIKGIEMIAEDQYTTRPIDLQGGSYFGWPTRQDVIRFLGCGRKFR